MASNANCQTQITILTVQKTRRHAQETKLEPEIRLEIAGALANVLQTLSLIPVLRELAVRSVLRILTARTSALELSG